MHLPEQNIRGVKRRRPDVEESEEDKEAKLRRKLHHALKELRKVIKKARTFEVQKTLKKLKEARRKDPESDVTKDLGVQVEILKHLSYDQLAHSALMTKLKKDKILSADPSIQAISVELASNQVSPRAPGTPTAKVQSRILSSKILASEVASIVETLRTCLHHSVGSEDIREATDNPHASPNLSKRRTGTGHEKDAFSSKDNVVNPSGEGSDEGYENTSDDGSIAAVDDGWESGTVGAPSGSDGSVVGSADDHDSSSGDSDDMPIGQGSSDESENPMSKKSQSRGSKGQSEFLPSLSVGFARGDSGSEFSDSETKLVDGIKKNRRGQRARRAIWEKKFGKNANHIMKQRQQETVRGSKRHLPGSGRVDRRSGNSSSQPHHTPTQSRVPSRGHEQVRKPTLGGSEGIKSSGSTKGQSEHLRHKGDLRGNQGERPLHPSWEAKRKQKAASIVPSQGTKIVFPQS